MTSIFEKVKEQDPYVFFVVTRSWNKNVVVYSLDISPKDIVINPYWIMYEKDPNGNEVESLTIIEERFGFGYKLISTIHDFEGDNPDTIFYKIRINGLPEVELLCNSETLECSCNINDEYIIIKEIYVSCSPILFGMFPRVESITIKGINEKGNPVESRIING